MTIIVLIKKNCDIIEQKVTKFNEQKFHLKCGFKTDNSFKKRIEWNVKYNNKNLSITLWSKNEGRKHMINKYELPPPIDNDIFYGTMMLLCKYNDEYVDLTKEMWEKIYEGLFGGFEDIEDEESCSSDELDKVPNSMKTKNGYLKDGFVVDDSSENISDSDSDYVADDDNSSDDELEEEEFLYSSDEEN